MVSATKCLKDHVLWFCDVHICCASLKINNWFLFAKAYIIQFHTKSWFHILKLCLFPLQNQEAVVARSPCSRTGVFQPRWSLGESLITYHWFWCGNFPPKGTNNSAKKKSNKKSNMVGSITSHNDHLKKLRKWLRGCCLVPYLGFLCTPKEGFLAQIETFTSAVWQLYRSLKHQKMDVFSRLIFEGDEGDDFKVHKSCHWNCSLFLENWEKVGVLFEDNLMENGTSTNYS